MTITTEPVCTECGEASPTLAARPNGAVECLPCYLSGLIHGHQHVDHDPPVADCPLCTQEIAEEADMRDCADVCYTVVVGNIGQVHYGTLKRARAVFAEYLSLSKANYGRCAGEPVTLIDGDGEIVSEYPGTVSHE